jgi:type I restriction-modification system DNA methylase subunit
MDASHYKDYVLTMLFMKYVSSFVEENSSSGTGGGEDCVLNDALKDKVTKASVTARLKELEVRYSGPLPTISQSVDMLGDKVAGT